MKPIVFMEPETNFAAKPREAPTAASLRSTLAVQAKGWRAIGASPGAWLIPEFVAQIGVACVEQPLPRQYRQRIPKRCFANAAALVKRNRALTYVEGYVSARWLPFPIHHAWAVDWKGRVIDPTLAEPAGHVYLGVHVTPEEYAAETSRFGGVAVLCSARETVNFEFILSRCPAIADLMPKGAA